jgi:hypothetical protein
VRARDLDLGDWGNMPAHAFLPKDAAAPTFYVDGVKPTLTTEASATKTTMSGNVNFNPNAMSFITRFKREMVMLGSTFSRIVRRSLMLQTATYFHNQL